MMVCQSYTAVLERNAEWQGEFAVEPYEAAWAAEAVYFIRALEAEGMPEGTDARVQISPDGMHWCDEGAAVPLPRAPGVTFGRVCHFGGWLRLVGELPAGARAKVIVYLVLKE